MSRILLFIIVQSICVVTSTIKSVITIKGSRLAAVIISTVHYVINALTVYFIGNEEMPLWAILLVTCLTNIIGVWLGLVITDRIKKDQLWRISATVKVEHYKELVSKLKEYKLKFVCLETDWEKIKLIDIFSQNRQDSAIIHQLFDQYNVKYTVNSSSIRL